MPAEGSPWLLQSPAKLPEKPQTSGFQGAPERPNGPDSNTQALFPGYSALSQYPSGTHSGPSHPSGTHPGPSHPYMTHPGPNPYCVPQQPHSELREVCCTCLAATSHMRTLNSTFIDFHLSLFPTQSEACLPCPRTGRVHAHPVLGEAPPQVSPSGPMF